MVLSTWSGQNFTWTNNDCWLMAVPIQNEHLSIVFFWCFCSFWTLKNSIGPRQSAYSIRCFAPSGLSSWSELHSIQFDPYLSPDNPYLGHPIYLSIHSPIQVWCCFQFSVLINFYLFFFFSKKNRSCFEVHQAQFILLLIWKHLLRCLWMLSRIERADNNENNKKKIMPMGGWWWSLA